MPDHDGAITVTVSDLTGQKKEQLRVAPDTPVDRILKKALHEMGKKAGEYKGRRDSDGLLLNGDEKAGDVLKEGAELVLTPQVDAGAAHERR